MRYLTALVAFTITGLFVVTQLPGAPADDASTEEFFETRIRPVLAVSCFGCHSNAPMADLRVDSLDAMVKGGSRGPAIIPGDPENSLLIQVVKHTAGSLKMPLGGDKLKDSEIADLEAWIKAGAVWPKGASSTPPPSDSYVIPPERKQFWSFVPLQDAKVPTPKDTKWAKTDIDRFVMAKLEEEGLKPVGPASKHDLLRRASMDLIGLPPTPDEYEAFEKDTSPDAFAKVVDRLLASPQYGERWGRVWLDVARYGEDDYRSLNPNPKGYFPYANAYMYRDWVIQAINDDMPYDQFVKAQLAGDLMDESIRYKMLPATGFLGLGPWYFDNGAVEVTRADERHDRVDVVTRGFLGLTGQCARCHNHKYDPIPQTDYYSLAGVFLNTEYHEYPTVPEATLKKYMEVKDQVEKKQSRMQEMQGELSSQLSQTLALKTSDYLQGVFDVKGSPKKEVSAVVESRKLDYELLERWIRYMDKETDKYPTKKAWQEMMKKGGNAQQAKKLAESFQEEVLRVMIDRQDLDEENEIIYAQSLEGTKKKKRANKPNEFKTNDDFCPNCGLRLKNMPEDDNNLWTEIFQRELRDNEDPNVNMNRQGNPGVLMFRGWGLESRIGAGDQARLDSMRKEIDEQRKELEPAYPFIHGVQDLSEVKDLELAIRGNPQNLGDKVPRHFLSALSKGEPEPFKDGSGRLELANDIVSQPIAMRVIVNRLWKGHFGTGIVDTPSNFGFGGERPTNPELLEYLATYFVEHDMSMKAMHRLMMLTSVYQLSTANDEANFAKDSGNRYYWRADHRRMDAEQLRDSIMFVSGNLDTSVGGPSADLTPAMLRRTVYGKVSRYKLDTYLQTFDFPSPAISAEKRFTTTVPLQRLFLMNSDFVQIEAEALAKRVADQPSNRARIVKAYDLVFGRTPSEEEISLGLQYLSSEPLKEYEEAKAKEKESGAGRGRGRSGRGGAPGAGKDADKSADKATDQATDQATNQEGSMISENKPKGTEATEAKVAAFDTKPVDAKPAPGEGGLAASLESTGGEAKPSAEKPAQTADAAAGGTEAEGDNAGMGMGMMGGIGGRRGGRGGTPEVKYDPTAWGRYAKILLGSSEFLFIN